MICVDFYVITKEFYVIHKVDHVGIFVLLENLKIKADTVVHHIYFDSKCHIKYKCASTFIQLVNIFITGRNEVVAKVIFLHPSVILFTGGCLPQCMLGYPPGSRHIHPLEADTPPRAGTPLGADTPPESDTP